MRDKVIVLYSRLSSDDGFKANDESNSIANQKKLLNNYVKQNTELSEYKTLHIWDDGYSGTNFERPGVTKLLEMVKRDEVYCIIVKDFSRFGRNYIEVGSYLEEIFPILGVRFISVNDGFDSKYKRATGSIDVGFKNLIHSHYPQETSRKVSQAKMLQAKMGMYISAFAFFGYIKSAEDKHQLEIDEPAAEVVRYIFKLRLEKLSITEIARRLNDEGIMTPVERKRQLGSNLYVKDAPTYWTAMNVSTVLYDERYTGKLVYLKSKRKSDITFDRKKIPRNEWMIIDADFEPIISQEVYDAVFAMRRNIKTHGEKNKPKLFCKIIRCGYCGRTLTMHGHAPYNYYCSKRRFVPEAECKNIKISEEVISNVVLKMIRLQADVLLDYKEKQAADSSLESKVIKNKISELQRKIEKRDAEVFVYYEQYKNGSISKADFIRKKEIVDEAAKSSETEITLLEEKLQKLIDMEYVLKNDEFARFEESRNITSINRELIEALISHINVYDSDRIEIVWKYQRFMEGEKING